MSTVWIKTVIPCCLAPVLCLAGVAQTSSAASDTQAFCPPIAIGADVSFLPQTEASGHHFSDSRGARPGLEILREHGYGWVRLRLFVHPMTLPNDLSYTIATARQAKALGFGILLDFHYSDDWADPQHNNVPKEWARLSHAQLVDQVFAYTRDTIAQFRTAGVLPNVVQIGNEITSGMMWPDGKLPDNWNHFNGLLLAAARGVQEGSRPDKRPAIMIHIDQGGNSETTEWFFSHLIAAHVPFDIIGQSYYPWWQGSLKDLRDNLAYMAKTYRKPIIVVETAWSWKPDNYTKKRGPFDESPEGQAEFLRAVAQAVADTPDHLGKGVFWWEPAVGNDLVRRGLFDDNGKALPALDVFDGCMTPPQATPPAPHSHEYK
ncbi:glycoside hydrolase family 53 protein [Bryocella elongata]|uniref:glycoside hydrolase family 53 protein n=1 Tax=Bryocella elongata TaxID=863522 RepID=UPI00190ECC52|nr:glycosyl hydrolase 53 family protein [Bryocella elongata]